MARNSQIIIAKNIRLDKEYKEVLNYTEQEMLSLVDTNKVATATQYSFIRDKGTISTSFTYNQALQCNYMAFQNSDYNNKWFFAWIDDVRYVNDGTTEISYTIDSWSTWFNKLTVTSSFVIREHVNDDTRGLHTLPENVETGEYISYSSGTLYNNDSTIVIATTFYPTTDSSGEDVSGSTAFGIYNGYRLYAMKDVAAADKFLSWTAKNGKSDSIQFICLVPNWILRRSEWAEPISEWTDINGFYEATTIRTSLVVPSTIDGYTPKNNKCLVFPYQYFGISNNAGTNVIYKYENMNIGGSGFQVVTEGTVTPSCSIKTYIANYKESITNYDGGITGAKYPICSWATDVFTNWLTQNAVNIALDITGGIVATGVGIMSGNGAGALGGMSSIANSVASIYQHSLASDSVHGNTNNGDVAYSTNNNVMTYAFRGVKAEYIRVIDEYFSRYGYKINQAKVPNITGRRYWNYIQIADTETLGYGEIPQRFMDEINTIARNGTTIWHSHDNIGNYTLDNAIVNP